jgi:serine/threonine protein kinase
VTEPLDDNQIKAIEEAVRKFVEARWHGQEPDIEAFVKQYPGLEHRLRQDIQAMQKIDGLFDSLVQADDTDFEESGQDLIGQSIGGLEVKEMIGRGGMGVVYRAHDSKLERSVAVKSIPAQQAHDTSTRMRFQREAKVLASLNHPNIAVIHDIIEQDEDTTYLVLEYIPGDTLAQRITRAPLPMDQALSIAQQIAEAVSAAHKKGVVHRDLKPGNIKITPDNRVKVLDFGLAKASGNSGKSSRITVTEPGYIMGTPAYMSPEQARGHATDARTDIWSFGCILYEMLSGRLPFAGETATDTLARIIEREPDWDLLPQETPTNIRDLLRACLQKDVAQRVQRIADARKEISAALSNSTTSATITTRAPSRKTLAIIAVPIIVVLAIALWFSLKPDRKIRPTKNEQAYRYFQQGNEYYYRAMVEKNAEIAIRMYQQAVYHDPQFALAYARLSIAHIRTYHWWDHSEAQRSSAKDAMDTALDLDPNLPAAYEASGRYYHYVERDSDRALKQFNVALEKQPRNSGVLEGLAHVHERLGRRDDAIAHLKAAYRLNPSYPLLAAQVGRILADKGERFQAEAVHYLDRAIGLAPEQSLAYQYKAWLCLEQGNIAMARGVLSEALDSVFDEENITGLEWHMVFVEMCDGNYEEALRWLSLRPGARDGMGSFTPRNLQRAEIYRLMGDGKSAEEYYRLALPIISARIEEEPENDWSHRYYSSLGIAYAGLGQKLEAVNSGKRGAELAQEYGRAERLRLKDMARIYAIVGDPNAAIDQIEILLEKPPGLSIPQLKIDPAWKPIREHPGFKQLVEEE